VWDVTKSFSELSDTYYKAIAASRSQLEEEKILEGIATLDYDKLDDFRLIEERPGGSVFIELDDHARSLFDKYEEIRNQDSERGKAMGEFLKIRSDFYQYVVNVPERYLSQLGEPISGIYRVNKDSLSEMYDAKGFIRNPSGII